MEKKFIQAMIRKADGRLEFIATDETLDRQGEVIPIDSWDLTNYRKNPVLLVNHEYKVQNIVGRAENLSFKMVDGRKALAFEPVFHGVTQLAREVAAMVQEGVLVNVSVGFLRKSPEGDGDRQINELMEISFVPVPANPSAERIRSLVDADIPEAEVLAVKSFLEVKEGRVLSNKTRKLIRDSVDSMKGSITAMEELLNATEPEKGGESNQNKNHASERGETSDTPELGTKGNEKGRSKSKSVETRVLKSVAREINRALFELKKG